MLDKLYGERNYFIVYIGNDISTINYIRRVSND